jgi:hypothetical protein
MRLAFSVDHALTLRGGLPIGTSSFALAIPAKLTPSRLDALDAHYETLQLPNLRLARGQGPPM